MNQAQRGTQSSTLKTRSSVLSVLRLKKKQKKTKKTSRCFTSSFAKRALQALQTVWLLWWLNQQEILGGEIWAKPCAWSEYCNFSVWVILKHFFCGYLTDVWQADQALSFCTLSTLPALFLPSGGPAKPRFSSIHHHILSLTHISPGHSLFKKHTARKRTTPPSFLAPSPHHAGHFAAQALVNLNLTRFYNLWELLPALCGWPYVSVVLLSI